MLDLRFAWRNLWRHGRRSVLTMLAIAFASAILVFSLSFQLGSYDQMVATMVRIEAGHLQVMAEGYNDKAEMRRVIADPAAVEATLVETGRIAHMARRADAFVLASSEDRTYGGLLVGIEPEREAMITTGGSNVVEGAYLRPQDGDVVLVGRLLAQNLKLRIGDELVVLGQGRDGSTAAAVLIVQGLVESGLDDLDRALLYMPLQAFDEVFAMEGAVHRVVALADDLDAVDPLTVDIDNALQELENPVPLNALSWSDLLPGIREGIELDFYSALITYAFLVIVVTFSILNTFLMAILERTREFGVMMAIGARPWALIRLVMLESTRMTVIGITIGTAIGTAVAIALQDVGIKIEGAEAVMEKFGMPERLYPVVSLESILPGPAIVLAATLVAAFYPALRLVWLKPVDAMRQP